jgi:uncharacterized protein YkwD
MTNEGPAAVNDAISALRSVSGLQPYEWSDELSHAAQDHVNDCGPKGLSGHTGSDGSSMTDRVGRYC